MPSSFFFFNDTATTEIYTLSLHDALPICTRSLPVSATHTRPRTSVGGDSGRRAELARPRSEEHTSELQSHVNLVCRLLLEKKKKKIKRLNRIRKRMTIISAVDAHAYAVEP